MSRNGKETKIPALTEVEAKQVEKIRSSISECINGLAKAISDIESLVKKNTTSKDLKEFNKWLLDCHNGFNSSSLESLEFDLNGILTDIESRSYYQKVYRDDLGDLGYDYVDKEDLEIAGFFKCPSCGAWLFDSGMDCPECGRKSKIIYLDNERFFSEPFKIETGLRIEPSLLNFEEIAAILRKHTPVDEDGNVLLDERVNIADDIDDDGWPEIGNGEDEEDAWVNCSECPGCCECSGCMGFEDADDFEKCIEEQVIENYGKAMVALEDLQLAVAEMAIGPHINSAKSNPVKDFAESVYYSWVYNTFFGNENGYYNLPTILHQLQTSLDELLPHLNNDKKMVMAKVYEQIDTGEEIEEFSRTKYIPLEEAQETARICPNCGMWVDNEIDNCDCGEWLEPVVTTSNAPEKIKLSLEVPDGFTVETLSKAMGGSGGDFYEEVGDDTIHLMTWNGTGHLGCSTAFRVTELSEWVGDDYVFVSLEKEDDSLVWVLKTDYIAKAFSESPAVVKKTFKLLYDSVAACLGEDYADDLIMTMDLEGEDPGLSAAIAPIITAIFEREDENVGVCSQEDFNDYVEWLIENEGKQAAFEYCAKVYQKNIAIVGDWVQKLGEELASELKKED